MNMCKTLRACAAFVSVISVLAGCTAMAPAGPDYDAMLADMMKASFRDQGIATVDRLRQDDSDVECSKAEGKALPDDVAKRIETANLKTVKMRLATSSGSALPSALEHSTSESSWRRRSTVAMP